MEVKWSGFSAPFSVEKVKSYATESAGVYLLSVRLKTDKFPLKWRCSFVGQAKNIKQRLLDHLSDSEENKCIKEMVSKFFFGFEYAVISKQEDRAGAEKYLYDHYKPECNNVDPGGKPIEINLPYFNTA